MPIKPDQLDLEALEELELHAGWKLYRERQRRAFAQLIEELTRARSWEEALRVMGRIEQARVDALLPKVIADEIRKQRSKG
ncbi:MAG TPA: hypothetical protein VE734_10415 [Terriglobales bacterium]|jgi:hypothetical protein|nr:hypothetical protein [Terriglobales bacterium]